MDGGHRKPVTGTRWRDGMEQRIDGVGWLAAPRGRGRADEGLGRREVKGDAGCPEMGCARPGGRGIDGPRTCPRESMGPDRLSFGRQCVEHCIGNELVACVIEMHLVPGQDARLFIPGIILKLVVMKEFPQINQSAMVLLCEVSHDL